LRSVRSDREPAEFDRFQADEEKKEREMEKRNHVVVE
jgi:hypothetical protein